MMKDVAVTLELNSRELARLQTLACATGQTVPGLAARLLERGLAGQTGKTPPQGGIEKRTGDCHGGEKH